jgi:signal peptidase I
MEIEGPKTPPWYLRYIFGRNPGWTVVRILCAVLVTLVLFKFVLVPIRVTGESMFPTFKNGQIKFVNKLAYRRHDPERGDVVAVEYSGKELLLLKRIVALPGETFRVYKGECYVNGEKLVEPYAHGRIPSGKGYATTPPMKLGSTEYVILGDNRKVTEGFFKYRKEIIGKVL